MISIGLLGAKGRMGSEVLRLLEREFQDRARLSFAHARGESLDALFAADVVIDFSSPSGAEDFAKAALTRTGAVPALVTGSTGWTLDQRKLMQSLAERTPVIMASNFSMGVQTLLHSLKQASAILDKLGYTAVITETHHRHKKDVPSGTALSLQRVVSPMGPGNVQTHSVRAGEVIGDHEVSFHGPADRLTFTHSARDRSIFARGAIDVALWLAGRKKDGKITQGMTGIEPYFNELLSGA